jgi:transglutaminase-like putative cysteine protease
VAGKNIIQEIPTTRFKSLLGNWHGWLTMVLVFLVLEIAILSIEQARWITPQPSLTLVLFLAMLATLLIAGSRLPNAAIHVLVLILGIIVTLWQAYTLISPLETTSRFDELIIAFQSLWQTTGTAMASDETIFFAIFLTFLTWVMGYISTWFILQKRNAWVAVSLGAAAILVNLSNLPNSYYVFFGCYFLAAMLLIAQNHIAKRYSLLKRGTSYSKRGLLYLTAPLLLLVILAVSIAWVTPEIHVPQLETTIATKILWKHDIEESRLNLFGAVPAKQALSTSSTRRDLPFGKKWHQGNQVHFVVSSEHPSYWRVHVYDTYTSQGWINSPSSRYTLEQDVPWGEARPPSDQGTITYKVTTNLKTDMLLTAGGFLSSNTPVVVHVGASDIVTVTTPRLLRPGEHYMATSLTSSARPDNLARTGDNYPQYITDNYLQLPSGFPESVRRLSESITSEAKSPYEKVLAIDNYLSQIPYEEEVEAPPEGTDGVEHFLFTQKSGFCVYYASAMAVMLRSVDVPSRLVVGYLPGEPGEDVGQYTLRDKHYHTWPQVYFPDYGWVDVEATPSDTEGEVAIEIPWVSGQVIERLPQWDIWLELGALTLPSGTPKITPEEKPKNNSVIRGRLPFADVLGKTLLYIIIGIFIVILLLFPVFLFRSSFYRWLWRVDRANAASMVYARMCRLASLVKLGPKPQQTPLEYTAELTSAFPQQARSLDSIVQTYVENRFGRKERLGLFEEANLLKSRCFVFETLLKRTSFIKRLFRKRL